MLVQIDAIIKLGCFFDVPVGVAVSGAIPVATFATRFTR